jgi:trehalose 2-sulfotransferase
VVSGNGIDAYLICGTPRAGSTLLCGLLRDTGIAGRPESYFRLPDEPSWADRWHLPRDDHGSFDCRDYVRAAIAEGSTSNGIFAARVMWGTLEEMVAKLCAGAVHSDPRSTGADLDLLARAFGRLRFLHCWREDTVAQAVSWARSSASSAWISRQGTRSCFVTAGRLTNSTTTGSSATTPSPVSDHTSAQKVGAWPAPRFPDSLLCGLLRCCLAV